ncbi:MAG: cell division protein ZapA [Treponema sp.]|nr:cell division protein ZapA [Treponema sp.]
MGSLKIDVFNSSFTINATEDDAYLQKLLGYYKKIISQIQKSGSLSNPVQISALAGIMLCDELYKEKSKLQMISQNSENSESEIQEKKVEKLTKEMIEKINRALS